MNRLNVYLDKIRDFLINEDEEGFKRYLNLIIVGVAFLLIFILIIALWPSKKDTTLILNPNDTNQTKEEIPFEDNQAVAVSPSTKNALSNERSTPPKESPFKYERPQQHSNQPAANIETPQEVTDYPPVADEPADEEALNVVPAQGNEEPADGIQHEVFLMCDTFKNENQAQERKANIAFTTGFISKVVFEDNAYHVLVGPFGSRNEAIRAFNKMDDAALADECKIK